MDEAQRERRFRYGKPNKWDHADFGTEIFVKKDHLFKIYKQCGSQESNPTWISFGFTTDINCKSLF
jgi:hypothetical protein